MRRKHTIAIIVALFTIGTSQVKATDLTITGSANGIVLSWPHEGTNDFYLQFTTNLAPPVNWSNAADPTTNGTDLEVADDGTHPSCFFRLRAWQILFDGSSTEAFRAYGLADFPDTNQWVVTTNGELMTVPSGAPLCLITRNEYSSYELRWEWKTSTAGNSGVQYRANEHYANTASAGPEYQLLDDLSYAVPAKDTTGAAWGLFAPTNKVLLPVGQWNQCKLILQGNHVQHWLNGRKVVEYEINSPAWANALTALGPPYNVPGYGQGTGPGVGNIVFRNDTAPTWFRNIKIRELPAE